MECAVLGEAHPLPPNGQGTPLFSEGFAIGAPFFRESRGFPSFD